MAASEEWQYSETHCGYVHQETGRFVGFRRVLNMGIVRGYEVCYRQLGDVEAWSWLCEQLDWITFGRAQPCPCCRGQLVIPMEGHVARRCLICGGTGHVMSGRQRERR